MAIETLHKSKHILTEIKYLNSGEAWYLTFDKNLKIRLDSFWRLLQNGTIKWTSKDHQQKYGRSTPIDLQAEIRKILELEKLKEINRNILTGDLYLDFSNNYTLELFTDSVALESWEVTIENRIIIGMGKGEIANFN